MKVIILGLALAAVWSISQTSVPPAKALALPNLKDRSAPQLYAKHCASCHGKDGRSKTFKAKFNHARNLTEPGWQDAVSDERIFNSIANGRGDMPKFSKKVTEAEIDSLVLYVRGLKRE